MFKSLPSLTQAQKTVFREAASKWVNKTFDSWSAEAEAMNRIVSAQEDTMKRGTQVFLETVKPMAASVTLPNEDGRSRTSK